MLLRFIVTVLVFVQLVCALQFMLKFCARSLLQENDIAAIYGPRTWVLITGCGSGQGKRFALEFAKRRFNVILAGRASVLDTQKLIHQLYPLVRTETIVVDFCDAHKDGFFAPFEHALCDKDVSIVVNNVGNRAAWAPYTDMPPNLIRDTIVCGTLVQARLSQLALRHFEARKKISDCKSLLLNVTSTCMFSNVWLGQLGEISLPYLSVYEGANAFGFYHSNSLTKEYQHDSHIEILNIMPGAVVTENTAMLTHTPGAVTATKFVQNVFKLMGHCQGPQFAHWGHELSAMFCSFIPAPVRNAIFADTGVRITQSFMRKYKPSKQPLW